MFVRDEKMNAKKLKKFKDILIEEKEKTLDGLMKGDETYKALKEDTHGDVVDIAFHSYETQFLLGLNQKEKEKIDAIDAALKRIENGVYGKCIDCGEEIMEERLLVLPYSTRCVACRTKFEEKQRRKRP